jgi:glycosyltransferase involved in cell wall biosynthesis
MLHLHGLEQVIHRERPTHIIVDGDPASRLVLQAIQAAAKLSPRPEVWALTAENMTIGLLQAVAAGIARRSPQMTAGALLTWWFRKRARRRLDGFFTLSAEGSRVFRDGGFPGRIVQIPLGFDETLFFPQPKEDIAATRAAIGLTLPTIAYFGRLIPEKGIPILLDALSMLTDLPWQLLLDRFSDYENPYSALIRQKIEALNLHSKVVFFDATHTEIPRYMNAADFVVLPSVSTPKWKEQYGRVIHEAMACGKVVIGSNSGAIPEMIGEAGFLFPEGEAAALAARLRSCLTTPPEDLIELRELAACRSRESYSVQRQALIWSRLPDFPLPGCRSNDKPVPESSGPQKE